jgi:tetratricopeptide (TPR) repeat protein
VGFSKLLRVAAGIAVASLLASAPAFAQSKKEEEEKKPAATIDQQTGKKLQAAMTALDKNPPAYAEAKASLDSIKQQGLSPYEASRVFQLYAAIYNAQERYGDARGAIQKAIDSGGMNELELDQAQFNIAQLYLAEEKWREGAAALESWIAKTPKPNSNAYYLLAVAYYQQGDERRALPPAEKALAMSDKPQPSWLQLVLALYLKNDMYAKAEPLVRKLVAAEPNKKAHWVQLSAVLGAQEKYDDALVALNLAYHAGLLTEDADLRRLADLMAFNNIPQRCATLLTKEIAAKRLPANDAAVQEKLSNCWVAAREWDKAVAPLRSAAQLKRSGDLYVRLGEVQVQREDWNGAIEALRRALEIGNAKDPGNAQLLLGMSYYNLKKPQEARQWFQRAMGTRHSKQAEGWIRAIDTESGA